MSPIANDNSEGERAQKELLRPPGTKRDSVPLPPLASFPIQAVHASGTDDWHPFTLFSLQELVTEHSWPQPSALQSLGRDSAFSLPWPPHQARQAFQFPHLKDKDKDCLVSPPTSHGVRKQLFARKMLWATWGKVLKLG